MPYRAKIRRSIRARLTFSHLVAVTASTFIYATGGFFLLVLLYFWSGYTVAQLPVLVPQFFLVTIFVLIQIALITFCGMFVARLASRAVSRKLIIQIAELESATDEFANGRLDRRVRIISDDELGHLAERFNFLAERLDELDRQRRSFVANVSHDLRTPIAIIQGHVDAQLHGDAEQASSRIIPKESFEVIEHETQTLAKLVDDLFMLSRLEEAALPVQRVLVDFHRLASEIVDAIRPYALKTSRVSVNSLVPEDLPFALGDPVRIRQIVNNLLHNAIRHTPAGGLVVLDTRGVMAGAWIEVVVRDTGVGIPADQLPFIFDRFYQGESIRETGGTGLGLSIVKQLVEIQGGTVSAQSTVGEGTAISFRLPAPRIGASTQRVIPPPGES
jgi:two-component system sensor histidine kinase BaeS